MILAADYLDLAQKLPEIELSQLTGGRGVVVVAPHPDDESLGCGGLIAACCTQGIVVRLVVLSDGAGSHPGSQRYPAARLCALREAEVKEAASNSWGCPSTPSLVYVCGTGLCRARA